MASETERAALHVFRHLLGGRDPDGVRDVEAVDARLGDRLDDLLEERDLCPRGVLRGELDLDPEALRVPDHVRRLLQHLLPRQVELVLQVDVGRREEDVDALHAAVDRSVDVELLGPREAADLGLEACLGDPPDALLLALGGDREAGLDDVDPELVQRLRYLELLLAGSGRPRASARRPGGSCPRRRIVAVAAVLLDVLISFWRAPPPLSSRCRGRSSCPASRRRTRRSGRGPDYLGHDDRVLMTSRLCGSPCFFCISATDILSVFILTRASSLAVTSSGL